MIFPKNNLTNLTNLLKRYIFLYYIGMFKQHLGRSYPQLFGLFDWLV